MPWTGVQTDYINTVKVILIIIFVWSCYIRDVWYTICDEDRFSGWEKMGKNWRLYNVICNCICFPGGTESWSSEFSFPLSISWHLIQDLGVLSLKVWTTQIIAFYCCESNMNLSTKNASFGPLFKCHCSFSPAVWKMKMSFLQCFILTC